MRVFEAVRVKGKLMAKCVATGEIAPKDTIRHIQLLNAEKNRQQLMVTPNGRVTRIDAPTTTTAASPGKMSFL